MEENENEKNVQNEENVENVEQNNNTTESTTATNETVTDNNPITEGETEKKSFVSTLKSKKNLIIGIVVAIIAILIVMDILIRSPKETVKKYMSYLNSAHTKKADKLFDYAGSLVFYDLDEDSYDDFWDEYKEYVKSDEWEEKEEELKETRDKEYYEDADEEIKDSDTKVKVKKINSVKKLGKNLYCVKAQIETKDEDGEKDKDTVKFYVMKKGLKSYVISMD